jgi:hypothetical protein
MKRVSRLIIHHLFQPRFAQRRNMPL